jgi:PilZ domain
MSARPPSMALIAPRPSFPLELLDEGRRSLSRSLRTLLYAQTGMNRRRSRDRRATARYQAELVCEEWRGDTRHYRLTYDLSTFGLSTQYGPRYPFGTRVRLAIHLLDRSNDPVWMEAEVVGHHDQSGGMRLAFRNAEASAVQRIHRYLFSQTRTQGDA